MQSCKGGIIISMPRMGRMGWNKLSRLENGTYRHRARAGPQAYRTKLRIYLRIISRYSF